MDHRSSNGVKLRADGGGDGWANTHRLQLGNQFLMSDIDCLFGGLVFGQNTGERLFMEYAPDNWANRTKRIRQFAMVAMFDRKKTEAAALSAHNTLATAFYLWLARVHGASQPKPPRFFYVIGGDSPPWDMIEVDIHTGDTATDIIRLNSVDWPTMWAALGLTDLRNELKQWVHRSSTIPPPPPEVV
jgi:hypothetical protein